MPSFSKSCTRRARRLRTSQTRAERLLWAYLRDHRLAGHRFRRQAPIGTYIVDFYCSALRLVVELDGGPHGEAKQRAYDERRTAHLAGRGIGVIRFANEEVLSKLDLVLTTIRAEAARRASVP